MTISRLSPARDFLTLREAMDRLFEDSFVRRHDGNGSGEARLPIDAYATDEEIVVTFAVPGLTPNAVEITIEGDTLTIRGEVPAALENVSYIMRERFHGPVSRTLQLNVPVDVEKAEASFENGILTLVLPKAEEVKPKVIKVHAK